MKNTPNYNLPQYEGADKFTKEVLNKAFDTIDSAINDLQETFNAQTEVDIDAKIIGEVIVARGGNESLNDRFLSYDEKIDGIEDLSPIIEDINNIKQEVNLKVNIVEGKGLSTNDYTNLDKSEVAKVKDKADKTYVDVSVVNVTQSIDNIKSNGITPTTQNAILGTSTNPFKDIQLSGVLKADNGYTKLPNGLVLQWGVSANTVNVNSITVQLPIRFPNAVFQVVGTGGVGFGNGSHWELGDIYVDRFNVFKRTSIETSDKFRWFAIGF